MSSLQVAQVGSASGEVLVRFPTCPQTGNDRVRVARQPQEARA